MLLIILFLLILRAVEVVLGMIVLFRRAFVNHKRYPGDRVASLQPDYLPPCSSSATYGQRRFSYETPFHACLLVNWSEREFPGGAEMR